MENFINIALLILVPVTTVAFLMEYVWSDLLEQWKPKTGSRGQPLGTTPSGFMRDQAQIDKEAPIISKFNEDMKTFQIHQQRFDKVKPYIRRLRIYSSIFTFLFGSLKLALLNLNH